jgi:hypothetical protein
LNVCRISWSCKASMTVQVIDDVLSYRWTDVVR